MDLRSRRRDAGLTLLRLPSPHGTGLTNRGISNAVSILFGVGRVLAYTVHEQPSPPTDRMDRAEALRFIKDGFSLQAAIAGPLWLVAHQLWRALAIYVGIAAVVAIAYLWFGLSDLGAVIALAGAHLVIGFEGDAIEREDLERQGWASLGSVTGASALDCQRRFFDQWLPAQPVFATKPLQPPPTQPAEPHPRVTSGRGGAAAAGRLAALWRNKS